MINRCERPKISALCVDDLRTFFLAGSNAEIYPFSDNSGDTSPMIVNSLAYYDISLSDAQIGLLGGPQAAGIPVGVPVPEPGAATLIGLGTLSLIGFSRRKR